jgi:hypothetical protein
VSFRFPLRLAAGAVGLALLAGSAVAQQPAPAAAPAPSAVVTPEQLAVARDVVVGSGISRSFDVVIPNIMSQITNTLTRTRPELTSDLAAVMEQLRPEFMKQPADMVDNAARIVASVMSEDELKQTAAFFASPAGKKYVSSQPVVLDRLVVAMEGWTQKVSEDMVTRIRAEMKKRGKDI